MAKKDVVSTIATGGLVGKGGLFGEGSLLGGSTRKPQTSYWGGSKEQYEADRDAARADLTSSVADARAATQTVREDALKREGALNREADLARSAFRANAFTGAMADSAARGNLADYRAGRGAILNNAAAIEQSAADAPANYQRTSNAQFAAQKDANQRAALALGASGGAGGIRSALAASSQANAQAAVQSGINQAQELNAIRGEQLQGRVAASQVRGGVGSADITAANSSYGRASNANQTGVGALDVSGDLATKAAQLGQDGSQSAFAGYMGLGGMAQQRYLGIEGAQLNAKREAEAAAARAAEKNSGLFGKLGLK